MRRAMPASERDVKIARATHLMHLEAMRLALWRESICFLAAEDVAPVPACGGQKGRTDVFRHF